MALNVIGFDRSALYEPGKIEVPGVEDLAFKNDNPQLFKRLKKAPEGTTAQIVITSIKLTRKELTVDWDFTFSSDPTNERAFIRSLHGTHSCPPDDFQANNTNLFLAQEDVLFSEMFDAIKTILKTEVKGFNKLIK